MTTSRRQIVFSDDLYAEVVRAAAREQAEKGVSVSVAEWVREACRRRLQQDG